MAPQPFGITATSSIWVTHQHFSSRRFIVTELVLQRPALNERTLLLELNHRINNEFASAINLVSVAAVRSDNSEVKVALGNVVELLDEHADVLRALKIPDDDALIDAAEYLRKLCFSMSRSRLERMNIRLVFAADTLLLQSDRCWRLGMILYELVTNSARHAFFEGRDGEVRVELSLEGALVKCRVSDNGSVSAGIKPGRGLRILDDLCQSLGGQVYHWFGADGSYFTLALPFTEHEQQANREPAGASRSTKFRRKLQDVHPRASVA
jgi:two-component sensor histidine kinase